MLKCTYYTTLEYHRYLAIVPENIRSNCRNSSNIVSVNAKEKFSIWKMLRKYLVLSILIRGRIINYKPGLFYSVRKVLFIDVDAGCARLSISRRWNFSPIMLWLVWCPFLRISTISPLSYTTTRLNNNDLVGFRLPIFQMMRRRLKSCF